MDTYSTGSWQSPDVEISFQRSYPTLQSHHNQLLQRAAAFYLTLDDSSCDSQSTDGSDLSRKDSHDPPVSASLVARLEASIPGKIERRRKQNRSAQRAYRDRKERRQSELEQQISEWQHKHELLSRSYSKQTEEITRLKVQIEQLNHEMTTVHSALPSLSPTSLNQSPTAFDLVSFFDYEDLSPSSPKSPRSHNAFFRL